MMIPLLMILAAITNLQTATCREKKIFFGQEIRADYNHGHVHILTTSHDVSLDGCTKQCLNQKQCDFINYEYRSKMCYLIEHFNTNVGVRELFFAKSGSILGLKTDWQTALDPAELTDPNVCGPPPNILYAEKLGNIYTIGSKVMYRCTITKTSIITCSSSGQWETPTNSSYICYPDHCYTNGDLWVRGDVCYAFLWNTTKNQADAQETCVRLGGHLLQIRNQRTQEFVTRILKSYVNRGYFNSSNYANNWVLIGLNDLEEEGTFKWIGDTTAAKFTYWSSNPKEPRGSYEENCVVLGPLFDYKWADVNCEFPFLTLCEINITVP